MTEDKRHAPKRFEPPRRYIEQWRDRGRCRLLRFRSFVYVGTLERPPSGRQFGSWYYRGIIDNASGGTDGAEFGTGSGRTIHDTLSLKPHKPLVVFTSPDVPGTVDVFKDSLISARYNSIIVHQSLRDAVMVGPPL